MNQIQYNLKEKELDVCVSLPFDPKSVGTFPMVGNPDSLDPMAYLGPKFCRDPSKKKEREYEVM